MGKKKSTKFPPDEWFEVKNPASALIAIGRALRALEKGEALDRPAAEIVIDVIKSSLARDLKKFTSQPNLQNHPATKLLRELADGAKDDKGGRGRLLDHTNRQWLVGAVKGARANGLKGDAAFDCAREHIAGQIGSLYSLSGAKKLFWEKHKKMWLDQFQMGIWEMLMEEPVHQYNRKKPS